MNFLSVFGFKKGGLVKDCLKEVKSIQVLKVDRDSVVVMSCPGRFSKEGVKVIRKIIKKKLEKCLGIPICGVIVLEEGLSIEAFLSTNVVVKNERKK